MARETDNQTPARRWREDAAKPTADVTLRLRLAAMAGHMASDRVAARRAALVDLLDDGRPHTGAAIRERLEREVASVNWGKRPEETLLRDIRALRRGGIRIAYSRRPGLEGYYLEYPPLTAAITTWREDESMWLERMRQMTVPQKQAMASEAADFALRQKRLILREECPAWPAEQIDREARRLVYGV